MTDQEILLTGSLLLYMTAIGLSFLYEVKKWELHGALRPYNFFFLWATGTLITSFFFQ
jgi:hypothetical protein